MSRQGTSWKESGADMPHCPPQPKRETLIEMAVGHMQTLQKTTTGCYDNADLLEAYGRKLFEDRWRGALIKEWITTKKIQRIERLLDEVYVYYVNDQIICITSIRDDLTDELLAQLGLALRFSTPQGRDAK
jgi:hypothetical protein